MQLYVDRLPGAQLEEKDFSLAWHYRKAHPEQASQRAKELLDDLADYTRNIDVQVLEGNKVLEVRNTGVTKGTSALKWLSGRLPGFILASGDDWTDEDLFRLLPPSVVSVRVGLAQTAARYYLGNPTAVRRMLRALLEGTRSKLTLATEAPATPQEPSSPSQVASLLCPTCGNVAPSSSPLASVLDCGQRHEVLLTPSTQL